MLGKVKVPLRVILEESGTLEPGALEEIGAYDA